MSKTRFFDSSFHLLTSWYLNLKILNLKKDAMLLVKTFLINNSRTKIFQDKHFLQNVSQEQYKKTLSEKCNHETFREI